MIDTVTQNVASDYYSSFECLVGDFSLFNHKSPTSSAITWAGIPAAENS